MANFSAKFALFQIIILLLTLSSSCSQTSWGKTTPWGKKQLKTTLEFYYQDKASGKPPTLQLIAQANNPNTSSDLPFGNLYMFDDPLTMGPDPASMLVGRAQGMYGADSLESGLENMSVIMAMAFTFNDGMYNESSISILAHNPFNVAGREMPVVGGTGLFRMARGYLLPTNYMINLTTGDAIIGYNVTLFHYSLRL